MFFLRVLYRFFVLSREREKLLTFFSLSPVLLLFVIRNLYFFVSTCVTRQRVFRCFRFCLAARAEGRACARSGHLTRPVSHMTMLLHCFLLTLSSCAFSCWFRCRRRAFASDTLGAHGGPHGEGFLCHPPCSPCLRSLPFLSVLFRLVCGCTEQKLMLACFDDMRHCRNTAV